MLSGVKILLGRCVSVLPIVDSQDWRHVSPPFPVRVNVSCRVTIRISHLHQGIELIELSPYRIGTHAIEILSDTRPVICTFNGTAATDIYTEPDVYRAPSSQADATPDEGTAAPDA